MRYLALDVGDRRIGLAVGDDAHGLVRPLPTLSRRRQTLDIAAIGKVAREEEVGMLVIGLPLTLAGDEGHQAERVRRFAEASRALGLLVELYDERHTSSEARLRGAKDLDAGAATVLLEDFLAQRTR
ncbi:MAG TPA: Holliday junction resolvase RuvX [Candidatus Limnocylindria bacterium]|nr:Holliday junction resolvase RuvX [Candidatus Limnocylindria bacterium]